jgi:hypothetical protein
LQINKIILIVVIISDQMSLPHSPGALVELGEGGSWPRLTALSGTQTPSLSLLMRVVSLRLWRWDGGITLLLCFWRWGKVGTEDGKYFPRQRFRLWAAGMKGGGSQEVWWGSTAARGDEIRLHAHTRAYTHLSVSACKDSLPSGCDTSHRQETLRPIHWYSSSRTGHWSLNPSRFIC